MFQNPITTTPDSAPQLIYSCTNESLSAVVEGMALSPDDTVLAIGGSGDQAFAILEFAGKVIVVDQNSAQVDFIRKRVAGLQEGDKKAFFQEHIYGTDDSYSGSASCWSVAEQRKQAVRRYFTGADGRLERVKGKLDNLTVLDPEDIFSAAVSTKYSKVYLSNALDDGGSYADLKLLVEGLPPDGRLIVVGSTSRLWIEQFCGRSLPLKLERIYQDPASDPAWGIAAFKKVV